MADRADAAIADMIRVEGSPSMGGHITGSDPARGGLPEWPEGTSELPADDYPAVPSNAAELLGFLNARPTPAASTWSWLDTDGKGR